MLLKNATVINPSDNFNEITDIRIEGKNITRIEKNITPEPGEEIIDLTGKYIVPGLIDIHCHLREPGYESKETIKTGIQSAINGGYTTICPMANTNPAVDNPATLTYTINKAKEVSEIGFHPVCALTKELKGEKIVNISELIENGAAAFSDDGKPVENMKLLYDALKYTNEHNAVIISHSEDLSLSKFGVINEGKISARAGLIGIPDIAESSAIARELETVKKSGAKYHFAHISTKRSVELIRQAKKEGLNITAETAPHYFSLSEDDQTEYDATYKVNPPLRTKEDVRAIIEGLKDGTLDVIATDHAPHTLREKQSPIQDAPSGIAGFETALSVALTYLVHSGEMSLPDVIRKFTYAPAKAINLKDSGIIREGGYADLTVIDLNKEFTVDATLFKSKCKISPFNGKKLKGKAVLSIIKGKINEIG